MPKRKIEITEAASRGLATTTDLSLKNDYTLQNADQSS